VAFNVNQSQKCSKVAACVGRIESGKDMVLVFFNIVHGKLRAGDGKVAMPTNAITVCRAQHSVSQLFLSGRKRLTKVLCSNVSVTLSHRYMSRWNLLILIYLLSIAKAGGVA
jgi:hypothetical protein